MQRLFDNLTFLRLTLSNQINPQTSRIFGVKLSSKMSLSYWLLDSIVS